MQLTSVGLRHFSVWHRHVMASFLACTRTGGPLTKSTYVSALYAVRTPGNVYGAHATLRTFAAQRAGAQHACMVLQPGTCIWQNEELADLMCFSMKDGSAGVHTVGTADYDSTCAMLQALMQPSKQSVEEVKRVVSDARHKMQVAPQPGINGTFNEEDFMDGDLVDDMH